MPRYIAEVIAASVIILIAVLIIREASGFPAGGGDFPVFAGAAVIAISSYWVISVLLSKAPEYRQKVTLDFSYDTLKPLVILALSIIYILAIPRLGYFLSTVLYMVIGSVILGIRDFRMVAISVIAVTGFLYVLFIVLLNFRLPAGIAM